MSDAKSTLKRLASCIILATDGDLPGQALAEELARRLGKERCWRVKWPKSYEVNHFKDANEAVIAFPFRQNGVVIGCKY
ncbi:hypothetical protein Patl1_11533 [Pistacia atlantica]|uniref:Uncharacterized protein n=1 Tax=Pistacia atlantica TaxID=434234 RepID=A0ACC1A808_9ROSI|nr:hypothetical protein Patl1_11533 [Pistacia atlantica]